MDNAGETNRSNGLRSNKAWFMLAALFVVFLVGGTVYYFGANRATAPAPTERSTVRTESDPSQTTKSWGSEQVMIAGQYADADVVDLGNGQYRLYYSAEPEIAGFNGQVYSAISTDGIAWTKEEGERKQAAVFPDVIKLSDNSSTSSGQARWRMYFQNAGDIKSAVSIDGLKFSDESGTRIDSNESGYNLENVGASSTMQLTDGSYIMIYRGVVNQPYSTNEKLPNQTTGLFFYATSTDGLTWQKKGLALDSRNETLLGAIDGADWVKWDDGSLRVYFWGYAGIYHTIYENGTFSSPVFEYSNKKDSKARFAPDPPADPTLIKIGQSWRMYYGQHTKGIYSAVLE